MFNALDKPFLDYTQEKKLKHSGKNRRDYFVHFFSNIYLQDLVEADKML